MTAKTAITGISKTASAAPSTSRIGRGSWTRAVISTPASAETTSAKTDAETAPAGDNEDPKTGAPAAEPGKDVSAPDAGGAKFRDDARSEDAAVKANDASPSTATAPTSVGRPSRRRSA